jgi:hypothetical protein
MRSAQTGLALGALIQHWHGYIPLHQHQARSKVRTNGTAESMPKLRLDPPEVWYETGLRASLGLLSASLLSLSLSLALFLALCCTVCKRDLVHHMHTFMSANTRRDRPVSLAEITTLLSSSLVSFFSLVSSTSHSHKVIRVR